MTTIKASCPTCGEVELTPADVALMGDAVHAIVEDWLWVSRQRADGVPVTWIPYSSSIGAVMVKADGPVRTLADLKGRKLGVAGGAIDKGWLMLQAYARDKAGNWGGWSTVGTTLPMPLGAIGTGR